MTSYSERFQDVAVTQLSTAGFEQLTPRKKMLAYYLAQAGLWGRVISLDQGSKHNLRLFRELLVLRAKLVKSNQELALIQRLNQQVHDSLYLLFAHNGVYHSTTGEKLQLPLSEADLTEFLTVESDLATDALVHHLKNLWFSDAIKAWRTVQKKDVDVVAVSGSNFYDGLTTAEVKAWRAKTYPRHDAVADGEEPEVPPYGFNERLSKDDDGKIRREVVGLNGLYGAYVAKIVENLQQALHYTENEQQYESLRTLIAFYRSGSAADFDTHCVAWTKDQASDIYYINGLIESYDDPLGVCCGFESIVAFKNPLQTAKVEKIIDHIQWFEDSMPFADQFKKEKAQGLSASSITVVSMAGETSPSLPLGINLPNSDWIRKKHGSKSVNLENSATSRSTFEKALREALYLPEYQGIMEKYLNLTSGLHTDLHEIAGHGSGKVLPGVDADVLGAFYSVIEECRADLVALYFMADENLKTIGVYDQDVEVEEAARAQYVAYLTNGVFGQLRRLGEGALELTQAHLRNRQLIALWVLEHADAASVSLVERDGLSFIQVNDVKYVRSVVGKLLALIQEVKSTGNAEVARDLVMDYGTKVDQALLKQVHTRLANLDMPKTVCFVTPELHLDGDNVELRQVDNFFDQQVDLFKRYCSLDWYALS